MKHNRPFYSILLIVLSISAMNLAGCRFGRRTPTPPLPPNVAAQVQGTPVAAKIATFAVDRGEVVQKVVYTGEVALANEKDLFFRIPGRIAKVYVEDGTQVEAGDLIATLDSAALELDLEVAMLTLDEAKEARARAEENLAFDRRQAELNLEIATLEADALRSTTSGVKEESTLQQIHQYRVELAQMAVNRLRDDISLSYDLAVRRAELQVTQIKQDILDGQIRAPFAGEVRFIDLPTSDERVTAQAYSPVARMVEPHKFTIELNLPKAQLEPLHEGMSVQISAASLPGESLLGKIAALPRPFGTSQGALTEIALANPTDGAKLHEGISVAVSIELRSKQNALLVPRTALREENQLYYVIRVEKDQLTRVDVAVGIISDDWVEILSGLQEGEAVAINSITGVAVK